MKTIRAFIAIPLSAAVQQALGQVTAVLADQMAAGSVRWVKPELLHLTLRFLGETAVDQLPAIGAAMDEVAGSVAPFELRLGGLGCFPNGRRPRVIWAGLVGETRPLLTLKAGLDAALLPFGWAVEERPFQAHLTLGRVNKGWHVTVPVAQVRIPDLGVPVTAVHLIESQLQRQGPLYTRRHSSRLGRFG